MGKDTHMGKKEFISDNADVSTFHATVTNYYNTKSTSVLI